MTTPNLQKPKFKEKCNQCGICCKMQVCDIGIKFGAQQSGLPCEFLINDDERYYCKIVFAEKISLPKSEHHISKALGIGTYCCSEMKGVDYE